MSAADGSATGQVPAGRPLDGEDRAPLRAVVFLATPAVLEALELLKADLGDERGAQSIAIRAAILEKAERVRGRGGS
jgi:hypothetical protein